MSPPLQVVPRQAEIASDPEHSLARAFLSFTEAASALERSYGQLQMEVVRLRHELKSTNRDLARSLEENHRMRQHLNRILEGLPCGVLVVDASGCVSIANPETLRLLGLGLDAPPCDASQFSRPVQALLDQARKETGEQEYHASGAASLGVASNDSESKDAPAFESAKHNSQKQDFKDNDYLNNHARWLAIRHAWMEQAGGNGSSIFILRDITDEKRLEREREALRRQQALVDMSALLAHEIRNPLGSLELFAGLLAESDLTGDRRQWVEHLQAGLRMLAATVNNVLHFHSLPRAELAPTDLGQLMGWAYQFLLPLAKQARVRLELRNGLEGIKLAADRHRLEQVLLNLALNALRFMPEGGWLRITAQITELEKTRAAEIKVADSGPGITPHTLARIFEPGFSTRPDSPGLGLAVCKKIVEQHGGTIAAFSSPGSGAIFTLSFPLTGAAQ